MARRPVQDFFLFLLGSALFAGGIVLFTSQVIVGSGHLGMGWVHGYGRGRGWGGWIGAGLMFSSLRGYEEQNPPRASSPDLQELRDELARLRERLDERDS